MCLPSLSSLRTCMLSRLDWDDRAFTSRLAMYGGSHIFHYIVKDGLVYLCMAEASFGRQVPFMFLEDIMCKWADNYGDRGTTALAYGMNEDFSRVLQKQAQIRADIPPFRRLSKLPMCDRWMPTRGNQN